MSVVRNVIIGFVVLFALVVCVSQISKNEKEARKQKWERHWELTTLAPFRSVKDGRSFVTVSELELLEMLSNDSECVENLTSVTFTDVAFRPTDAAKLSRLTHLISIGFYDCDNVDEVIQSCLGQQVHTISLETTFLSNQSLELLRSEAAIDVTMNGRSIREH